MSENARFEFPPREKKMEPFDSSENKKKTLIGIDYMSDGMYTMFMIKNGDMIPLRTSDNPIYLLRLAIDKHGKDRLMMSETAIEIVSSIRDSPNIQDIKSFVLE